MSEAVDVVFAGILIPFLLVCIFFWLFVIALCTGSIAYAEKISNAICWFIGLCITLYYGYSFLLPFGRMIFTGEFK